MLTMDQKSVRPLCGEFKDNGCHWPLRCHGVGHSLPGKAEEWYVVSIVIACTRAVKSGFKASLFRFYKKKEGIKTVKAPFQGSKLLFSP